MRIWDDVIPAEDREIYLAAGYCRSLTFGSAPAVIVIDVTYDFTDLQPRPILESIKTFRNSCGEVAWRAVPNISRLIACARDVGAPVLFTRVARRPDGLDAGRMRQKNSRALEKTSVVGEIGSEIVGEVAPLPGEVIIEKTMPSIFFGTPLLSFLRGLKVDTLLLTGCTTSGCIRASAVEAFSYNFPVAVVEECVFDRSQISHKISLFEMHAKYADVITLGEAIGSLQSAGATEYRPTTA